jgi:DNA polymerase-3 subunit delta'
MIWPSIIGQVRVKKQLLDLLSGGRLAHAYLFQGDEGVGKDAMALELARVLHCDRGGVEPCGVCPSCIRAGKLRHPDIHFITALPLGKNEGKGDGPMERLSQDEVEGIREQLALKAANPYHTIAIPRANVIKLNSIRELRRESALSTSGRKRRVIILSRAEDLNEESSNALLKTLEEPSAGTIFILTTAYPDRLLPTIRSRCHAIRFDPLPAEEIQQHLIQQNTVRPEDAQLVAHLSMGSYTRALELLQEDIAGERTIVVDFIRTVLGGNFIRLMESIDGLAEEKNRDRVTRFLNLMSVWFRDALVLKEGGGIMNVDQRNDIENFIRKFPGTDLPSVLQEVTQAISLVQRNGYIPLVLIRLSIRLKRIVLSGS